MATVTKKERRELKRLEQLTPAEANRLFVYGIFLHEKTRAAYGMSNPTYATVRDYVTISDYEPIAEAVPAPPDYDIVLTGLVVDVDPDRWEDIDKLEGAYNRIKVMTNVGEAWMYAGKGE